MIPHHQLNDHKVTGKLQVKHNYGTEPSIKFWQKLLGVKRMEQFPHSHCIREHQHSNYYYNISVPENDYL